jgi:hypothetical protein
LICEWRRGLRNEIKKTFKVLPPTRGIYNELKKVWDEFNCSNEILAVKINELVGTSLYVALMKSNTKDDKRGQAPKQK